MNGKFFLIVFSTSCIALLVLFFVVFKKAAVSSYIENKQDTRDFVSDKKAAELLFFNDERLDAGHLLFKSICYKCHVISPDKIISSETDYQFFITKGRMIYNGNHKGMPAYKQRLQHTDVENLAAFLTKIRANYKINLSH